MRKNLWAPIIAVALASGLTACSDAADNAGGELDQPLMSTIAADDGTAESTEPSSATSEPAEASESSEASAAADDEDCASLPNDPRELYPSGEGELGKMESKLGGGNYFWITGIDNNYDPCAPISWISFTGARGDQSGPAMTGASLTDGLALYLGGKPAGEMGSIDRIESIKRISPTELELSWGELRNGTAAGVTDHFTVTLRNQNGRLEVDGADRSAFYDEWSSDNARFKLGHY